MDWLLPLLIGLLLGWAIEFVIDYLFWRRRCAGLSDQIALLNQTNTDLEAKATSLEENAQLPQLQEQIDNLQSELDSAQTANATLNADLKAQEADRENANKRTLMLAGASGLVGAIGGALANNDEAELEAKIRELQAELAEKDELQTQLATANQEISKLTAKRAEFESAADELDLIRNQQASIEAELSESRTTAHTLQVDVNRLEAELETAQETNRSLEATINQLQTEQARANRKSLLLAGAGGLLGAVGGFLATDEDDVDDDELDAKIATLNARATGTEDSETQAQLEAAQQEIKRLSEERSQIIQAADAEIKRLRSQQAASPTETTETEAVPIMATPAEMAASDNAIQDLQETVEALQADLDTANAASAELEEQVRALEADLEKSNRKAMLLTGAGGLLGAVGGALLAKDDDEDEEVVGEKIRELNQRLEASDVAETRLAEAHTELDELKAKLASFPPFKWIKGRDNLTLLHGIGPVLEKRLNEGGITSFEDLAESTPEAIHEILGDKSWQGLRPESWIEQAKEMESVGEMLVLEDDTHVHSEGHQLLHRLNTVISENLHLKRKHAPQPAKRDRLQEIRGIGPTFERRLHQGGLLTFADLANADPERVQEIVRAKSWQSANIQSWIDQARLLADQ